MEIFIYEYERNLLSPPDLAAEIDRLQEELFAVKEQNLRTLADFRNYRRHIEHDVNMLVEVSNQGMINPLLNIISGMEKRYGV